VLGASPSIACNRGNSLLQVGAKPSLARVLTEEEERSNSTGAHVIASAAGRSNLSSDRDGMTGVKHSNFANATTLMNEGQHSNQTGAVPADVVHSQASVAAEASPMQAQMSNRSSPVAALATNAVAEKTPVRMLFLLAGQTIRQYLRAGGGGVMGISIFVVISLLSLYILCTVFRAEQLTQRSARSGRGLGASRVGHAIGGASPRSPARLSKYRESNEAAERTAASQMPQLCPGLVVPPNSDCVLVIRTLSELQPEDVDIGDAAAGRGRKSDASELSELDIFDLNGQPVLSASVVQPWPARGRTAVTIRTLKRDTDRLAICRAGSGSMGKSVHIYDSSDREFGSVEKDAQNARYILSHTSGDALLYFEAREGSFVAHKLKVWDLNRRLVANAESGKKMAFEPDGSFYQVRIAAGVDVGLVLSGLLSIDAMEVGWARASL
jgi:hypothetical protein